MGVLSFLSVIHLCGFMLQVESPLPGRIYFADWFVCQYSNFYLFQFEFGNFLVGILAYTKKEFYCKEFLMQQMQE